jgi:thioredoxin reductase (NADPH)
MNKYDIIIIGAGPAGIGCAISAARRKLKILVLEKGNVVNSIIHFPAQMTFFSTATELELHGVPFNSQGIKPGRIEAVKYYQSLVRFFNLQVETRMRVTSVRKKGLGFKVIGEQSEKEFQFFSSTVILATGFFDNPNLLGIPGESLDHVSHYYTEPFQHFNQNVIVVGGKNSAVEAALDLHRQGARVCLIHRSDEIKESVKYWVLPDLENRVKEGSIKLYLNSHLSRILSGSVEVWIKNRIESLPADAVYLLTGYHPDTSILNQAGAAFDSVTLIPEVDPASLQSSVDGLYLAGSIIAGRNANRIFIENSREHGEIILTDIAKKIKKPSSNG